MISRNYYGLLGEFSKHLSDIVDKIRVDQTIHDQIQDLIQEGNIDNFISFCVLYDMSQLFKIITGGSLEIDSVEMFGLILLSSEIIDKYQGPHMYDYKSVTESFSNGKYKGLATSIVNYSNLNNPISIKIKKSDDQEIISSQTISGKLSLPQLLNLIEHPLYNDYITTLYRFATVIAKADNKITTTEESSLREIYKITHNPLPDEITDSIPSPRKIWNESLNIILEELDGLIGLDEVKQEVITLVNFINIQKEREKRGIRTSRISYHCVLVGSPGTGKTTIARLICKIYKCLGILQKGQLVETDRSGLIAGYSGQTSLKVDRVINSALDGVLFIDEAYSLVGQGEDNYGDEAVSSLIKRMEDDRDRLAVIVAGYPEEMTGFIETNPGLKSRFNRFINFPDYTPTELLQIFEKMCTSSEYLITQEAKESLLAIFRALYDNRQKDFGNGRLVRNIFENTIENQSNRISLLKDLTKEILVTIEKQDIRCSDCSH